MLPAKSKTSERYHILCGICPDKSCKTKLYFPSYDTSIECSNCGQRHPRSAMVDIEEVTDPEIALHNMIRNLLVGNFVPKKTTDSIKVLGLSNYHCKLLSPLLTYYGMNKQDKARPLREVNQKEVFDCSVLGSRAFLIQPEHIGIMGYGRDQTGSAKYLAETLQMIYNFHDGQEVLIPIHADGDGHCLVHGISRALVGRELFWHALRINLKTHFLENLERYKHLFCDFVDAKEWDVIIAESDPDYLPGPDEAFGLQNIHIFGLANVLHRPIILLDSLSGLQSSGDYTGVFLPGLVAPEKCRGKDGKLNKPLCIAWSSRIRNHFIALVGVKGRPLPRLPHWMLTKAWGMPHELITSYIEFDQDDMCVVGGDRALQDKYIQRLATAMEEVFLDKHSVHPSVVADVHHYIYKRTGVVGVQQDIITENTRRAVQDNQLYRCLVCNAISQIEQHDVPLEHLGPGGILYEQVKKAYKNLDTSHVYSMPAQDITCIYDPVKDVLVVNPKPQSSHCAWCHGKQLRLVSADGSVSYVNGDRTSTPAPKTKCNCGYKHFWDSKEYDNCPLVFPVKMTWKGESVSEDVVWFQNESDPSLNSNAFDVAWKLVQKHFPGEFGSEKLVQQVVETILQNTAKSEETNEPISLKDMLTPTDTTAPGESSSSAGGLTPVKGKSTSDDASRSVVTAPKDSSPQEKGPSPKALGHSASKIILTGVSVRSKSKTLHKEELTLSQAERNLRRSIEHKAPARQRQKSGEEATFQKPYSLNHPQAKKASKSTETAGASDVVPDEAGSVDKTLSEQEQTLAPRVKKIRVTTSDGRQVTITLDSDLTFAQLQTKIESELQIPAAQQRIRCGFPPKELKRPEEGKENDPLPLKNGDKVMVEVLPDLRKPKESPMDMGLAYENSSDLGTSLADESSRELLRNLKLLQQSNPTADELDMQLSTLPLVATLTGLDLWTYVQRNPHFFENGGLYYRIVQRDLGLVDGKHCTLPSLTNKKFCYNGKEDHLELCLELLGHFPISDDMDAPQRLSEMAARQSSSSQRSEEAITQSSLSAGGSGVVKHGEQKKDAYVAFGGQAHTLSARGSEKDPDVRPKDREEHQMSCSQTTQQSVNEISVHSHEQVDNLIFAEKSDSSENLTVSDVCHSRISSVNQGSSIQDTAMETDASSIASRGGNQGGASSPMEVDPSKEFPTCASNLIAGATHEEKHFDDSLSSLKSEGHGVGISDNQTDSSSSEKPVYISKKLGPGYTVLMKQTLSGTSLTEGDDSDQGET